jgi:hypothetical protein
LFLLNNKNTEDKMSQSATEEKRKALAQLATLLEAKTEPKAIPDTLWADAGVKKASRLKDVQQEIQKLKKSVSAQRKEADESEEDEEDESGPVGGDKQRQDARVKKDVRRLGADKKAHVAAVQGGQFDMARDYV